MFDFTMIYGTAWKKEKTKDLVFLALENGFKAIDTACQPKHYNEKGVGEGIKRAFDVNIISREELYIQTKFTPLSAHDINDVPYNINDPIEMQVEQSIKKSLENLQVDYIDSVLLHSPISPYPQMKKVWDIFELFVKDGKIKSLGISNCYDYELFHYLYYDVDIKPKVLQNRFYKHTNYDIKLRNFCEDFNISYQSFWSLTANINHLTNEYLLNIAKKYNKTPEQIFYKFLTQINITPLNGTTSQEHMHQDLDINNFHLDSADLSIINTYLYN